MLVPGPGMSLAVTAAVLPGSAEHFHAWAPLIPQGPLTGGAGGTTLKKRKWRQREVTGLVQDPLARKWLRARSVSSTALRSPAIWLGAAFPCQGPAWVRRGGETPPEGAWV